VIIKHSPGAMLALGSAQSWVCRPVPGDSGEIVSSGIARTDHPDVAIIETKRGQMALCNRCPHRGLSLAVYGRVEAGKILCKHKYAWSAETGESIDIGSTGDAPPIKLYEIEFDENGVAYASAEAAE